MKSGIKAKPKPLSDDEVHALMDRIQHASSRQEFRQLREKSRLAPAYTADLLLHVNAIAAKRLEEEGNGVEQGKEKSWNAQK